MGSAGCLTDYYDSGAVRYCRYSGFPCRGPAPNVPVHARHVAQRFLFPADYGGATAARKLGANEWVGAAIPAALLTPEFLAMKELPDTVVTQNSVGVDIYTVDVWGIPMVLNDYGGQVFPPMLAAIALYWLERG